MGEQSGSTYGRRDIIKKTAVAGAVVWTAPVIVSSRALASEPSGPGGSCDYIYIVKIDGGPDLGGKVFCPFPASYLQLSSPNIVTGEYVEDGNAWFQLDSTVTLLQVVGKKRPNECNVLTASEVSGFPGRYTVPATQSHIYVVICSHVPLNGVPINYGEDEEQDGEETVVEQQDGEETVVEQQDGEETVVEQNVVDQPADS
jgi:hypothetical protein